LAANKLHILWIIFDNIKKTMYIITAQFGASRNESLTLP